MEDDVIKLLFWLIQELKKKNYLNDYGTIKTNIMTETIKFIKNKNAPQARKTNIFFRIWF